MLHDKYFETDEKISCRIDDSITPFYNTIHRLLWWVDKSEWIHFLFSSLFSRENWISSVIRQKGESQNGCFKKTKHAKFSEERTFLTPWNARAYQGVRNVRFLENLACFVFLNTRFEIRPFAFLPTILYPCFCSLQRDAAEILLVKLFLEYLTFARWFFETSLFIDGTSHSYFIMTWSSTSGV